MSSVLRAFSTFKGIPTHQSVIEAGSSRGKGFSPAGRQWEFGVCREHKIRLLMSSCKSLQLLDSSSNRNPGLKPESARHRCGPAAAF